MAIVIPCYNEAKRIDPKSFLLFLDQSQNIQFFFADDGSDDETGQELEQLCSQKPNAHFFHFKKNQGKAETVRQSFQKILVTGTPFDYLGFWDADLSTPLEELVEIQELLQKNSYEALLCSRIKRLGAQIERNPLRHFLGRIFITVVDLIFQFQVYDTQCGAKVFKRQCVSHIIKDEFISRWFFDVEILLRMREKEWSHLYEKPVLSWKDIKGSKLKCKDFLSAPFELLKIYLHYSFKRK